MSTPSSDVMDALMALNAGDDVTLTVQRDGEEQDISAHVTDAYREEPEPSGGVYVPGELNIHLDAANDTVKRLELPSHSLAVYAKDSRPGRWKSVSFTVWEPVTADDDDTLIVGDEYRDLGTITGVEVDDADANPGGDA
jgi:hypothetical protein